VTSGLPDAVPTRLLPRCVLTLAVSLHLLNSYWSDVESNLHLNHKLVVEFKG
jgi:hypothetical protein